MGELYDIVQAHLDRYGVREAEFSRRIGSSPQTVNNWKTRGVRKLPERRLLEGVSEVTGERYEYVLLAALVDSGYVDSAARFLDAALPDRYRRWGTGRETSPDDRSVAALADMIAGQEPTDNPADSRGRRGERPVREGDPLWQEYEDTRRRSGVRPEEE